MAEVVCKWVKRVRGNMNPHLKSLLNNGYMISIRTQRLFMKSHTEAHNRSIKANVRGDCSALIHLASSLYACVQHNADYVNWLICENNQSQGGTHRRGGTTELVYVTLDFSRRKSDMWDVFFFTMVICLSSHLLSWRLTRWIDCVTCREQPAGSHDNADVIYSTVCR